MQIYIHSTLDSTLRKKLQSAFSGKHTVVFRETDDTEAEALEKFGQAQWVLGNVPAGWLSGKNKSLEFWQLDSAGFDKYKHLHLEARTANMGDWFARPCAETIVGGLMALLRGIDALTLLKQNKQWVGHTMRPHLGLLDRSKVVVLGSGTIGMATRSILDGFRCQVKTLARTSPRAELHTKEELLAELPTVDILVNTLPGTADNFVDREVIAAMRPGSIYANVGRGNTTDEAALIEALKSGQLSGAVLDVTQREPLPDDSPLWTLPNVILTQHTGGGQADEDVGKVDLFLRNVENLENGKAIESEVDLTRGY
ncbi:D-2-hydroxyacid dehydrogenase [Salmonirosea aquatica]|uniref:D-2-hydroxyacid dehydrogenase n=1 Tax=Salmonirosea aquatica TaxID=2654236 RepID=A0A7C9BEQ2_9BACT|nr:D-2-hydroxyacid dehydrogenase [Cytophagaceae bacterium SJW1-29]